MKSIFWCFAGLLTLLNTQAVWPTTAPSWDFYPYSDDCSIGGENCPEAGAPDEEDIRGLANLSYGPTNLSIPAGTPTVASSNNSSVQIGPVTGPATEYIEQAIDALCDNSPGCDKTVYFKSGYYQVSELNLKKYHQLKLIGEENTVFSGTQRLRQWKVKKGYNAQPLAHTFVHWLGGYGGVKKFAGEDHLSQCEPGVPCENLQQLFHERSWVPQIRRQDKNKTDLPDTWYYLYDGGDANPNNDMLVYYNKNMTSPDQLNRNDTYLELSDQPSALANSFATDVTISNLKFIGYLQYAFRTNSGYTVDHCLFRNNHFTGFRLVGDGVEVKHNKIIRNGRTGVEGTGSVGARVHHNEFAYNNQVGFMPGQHAGGMKTISTRDLWAYQNYVHDNWGPGFWSDINCVGTKYYRNYITNHSDSYPQTIGLFYELSEGGPPTLGGSSRREDWEIYENLIESQSSTAISIFNSSHVEIYYNTLRYNPRGVYLLQDARTIDKSCRPGDPVGIPDCNCGSTNDCQDHCRHQIYNITANHNDLMVRSERYCKLMVLEVLCQKRDGSCNHCRDEAIQNRFFTGPYRVKFDYNRYAMPSTRFKNGSVWCYKDRKVFSWGWDDAPVPPLTWKSTDQSWNEWSTYQDQHSCVRRLGFDNARLTTGAVTKRKRADTVSVTPAEIAVRAYPIPFSETLYVELPRTENTILSAVPPRVVMTDLLGKNHPIAPGQVHFASGRLVIDAITLPPGQYHLRVTYGQTTVGARVVKR